MRPPYEACNDPDNTDKCLETLSGTLSCAGCPVKEAEIAKGESGGKGER